jgi:hypothetical protein
MTDKKLEDYSDAELVARVLTSHMRDRMDPLLVEIAKRLHKQLDKTSEDKR